MTFLGDEGLRYLGAFLITFGAAWALTPLAGRLAHRHGLLDHPGGHSTHATATEPHGFHVWFAVCGGIGAWIVHLTALSALARRTCVTGEDWVLHALTVGLAAVTVLAMVLSARLRVPAGAGAPEPERTDLHFLGKMGLLIGAINLVLILFEGALVFWIPVCG